MTLQRFCLCHNNVNIVIEQRSLVLNKEIKMKKSKKPDVLDEYSLQIRN